LPHKPAAHPTAHQPTSPKAPRPTTNHSPPSTQISKIASTIRNSTPSTMT
jgi:hypothetical protein